MNLEIIKTPVEHEPDFLYEVYFEAPNYAITFQRYEKGQSYLVFASTLGMIKRLKIANGHDVMNLMNVFVEFMDSKTLPEAKLAMSNAMEEIIKDKLIHILATK